MPPAFNLSQDQTLQFNLLASVHLRTLISLKANLLIVSSTCVSFTTIYFEHFQAVKLPGLLNIHTHTRRLFLLNFKELSCNQSLLAVAARAAKRCALYRSLFIRQPVFYRFSFPQPPKQRRGAHSIAQKTFVNPFL